jgi:hypothetical protein
VDGWIGKRAENAKRLSFVTPSFVSGRRGENRSSPLGRTGLTRRVRPALRAMANPNGARPPPGPAGGGGMSWLDNFKPPSPGPTLGPTADESGTDLGTDVLSGPNSATLSGVTRGTVTRPTPGVESGERENTVESWALETTVEAGALEKTVDPSAETDPETNNATTSEVVIETLKSQSRVARHRAEDAEAALEAMTCKVETLTRLLRESNEAKAEAVFAMEKATTGNEGTEGDASNASHDFFVSPETKKHLDRALAETNATKAELRVCEKSLVTYTKRISSLETDLASAREIARSTGELANQSASYIAELKRKHVGTVRSETELRAELTNARRDVLELRNHTHGLTLEIECLRTETGSHKSRTTQLEKQLSDAEDALRDGKRVSLASSQNAEAFEEVSVKYRDATESLHILKRKLKQANDSVEDAELRATEAELSCEAVKSECAAELERETSLLRERDAAESFAMKERRAAKDDAAPSPESDVDLEQRALRAENALQDALAKLGVLQTEKENQGGVNGGVGTSNDASLPENALTSEQVAQLTLELQTVRQALASAEHSLAATKLLSQSGTGVTESVSEIARLRRCGLRYDALDAEYKALGDRLKIAEDEKQNALRKAKESETDSKIVMERAAVTLEATTQELETLRRKGSGDSGNSGKGESSESSQQLLHVKHVTLKYFDAKTWDEQNQLLPVLAAVQQWDPGEIRNVTKARAMWEPTEVQLVENITKLTEMDLGVRSGTNALTASLGLGSLF